MLQNHKYTANTLEDLISKLLFIDKYVNNFIDANPEYETKHEVRINNNGTYTVDFKVWKI